MVQVPYLRHAGLLSLMASSSILGFISSAILESHEDTFKSMAPFTLLIHNVTLCDCCIIIFVGVKCSR